MKDYHFINLYPRQPVNENRLDKTSKDFCTQGRRDNTIVISNGRKIKYINKLNKKGEAKNSLLLKLELICQSIFLGYHHFGFKIVTEVLLAKEDGLSKTQKDSLLRKIKTYNRKYRNNKIRVIDLVKFTRRIIDVGENKITPTGEEKEKAKDILMSACRTKKVFEAMQSMTGKDLD